MKTVNEVVEVVAFRPVCPSCVEEFIWNTKLHLLKVIQFGKLAFLQRGPLDDCVEIKTVDEADVAPCSLDGSSIVNALDDTFLANVLAVCLGAQGQDADGVTYPNRAGVLGVAYLNCVCVF